ncbi:MAG: hypothetical protein GWO02_05365, partial [Gammaproteobacteria bacterium]|nr:hypothetical protein [Gammaproteobacteria bacterium]
MYSKTAASACAALMFAALSAPALAQDEVVYEVEVTNVTRGQTFTPILLASHEAGVRVFEVGEPA